MALVASPVTRMVLQRAAAGVAMLWLVSVLIFLGTEILPGDVAEAILGQQATPEALASIRSELGLDKPALMRYFEWLAGILYGDFGRSFTSGADIAPALGRRLSDTLALAGTAAAIAVPLALLLGVVSAQSRNSPIDRIVSLVTLSTISVPEFVSGYLLILLFGVTLGWFPTNATVYPGMEITERLWVTALPAATLVFFVLGYMVRMTRSAILNVLTASYIEMAELKGVSRWRIIWWHALPNAIAPIVNCVAITLAYLVVGVVVVEAVFVYPGMGQYMVDHVSQRDLPVVQACALIFAAAYIALNLLADVASILANPRLRYPR